VEKGSPTWRTGGVVTRAEWVIYEEVSRSIERSFAHRRHTGKITALPSLREGREITRRRNEENSPEIAFEDA